MLKLIKDGICVNSDTTIAADILIDGEKIIDIQEGIKLTEQMKVINARGRFVLPGGVDAHVHLDLPMFGTISSDDHYSGMKAAAFGGTTTVIDFVPHDLAPLVRNLEIWHEKADSKAAVDFGFHMNITHLDDQVEREIPTLPRNGVTSLKVFTAYNGRLRLTDAEIFRVLRIAGKSGILTMLHAENGDVIDLLVAEALSRGDRTTAWHAKTRPAWGAVESALRGFSLAAMAEAPIYLVHMNTAGEVDQLAYARSKGLPVMGETCPQYLLFTDEKLSLPDGAKWVCSPPLRTPVDNEALWRGLENQVIQTVATDHCPFFYDGTKEIDYEGHKIKIPGKELGMEDFTKIPNGLPGVGDRLPVLWTKGVAEGRLSVNHFVDLVSTQPAKIFGMFPRKGRLAVGSDADIVLWDPNKEIEYGVAYAKHRTDYSLFEGFKLRGMPEKVFLRGNCIVDDGRWYGRPGLGQYIHCNKYS